jgi:hypothetical protein
MALTELEPLLIAPTEALDVEYKSWLELATNDEHKALLAKAAIAIANEGGGHIVIGLREERPNLISESRPSGIAPYDQDLVNQIIRRFASPQFHCTLAMVRHPISGYEHAVIKVPGGFAFPIMSKSGTPQNTIRPHLCYMRKPGPESAPPENQADWERLLTKCLRNRREDMLDAIRVIVEGSAVATPEPTASQRQLSFAQEARASWEFLTDNLEANSPVRCPMGRFEFDYVLLGDFKNPSLTELLDTLRRAVLRHTGWPEFWVPTKPGMEPEPVDGVIECWLGKPGVRNFSDSAHADFWRASPEGRLFLLRGFGEDSERAGVEPGKTFDIVIPTWRLGEVLSHASKLASLLAPDRTDLRVLIRARWYGLRGRRLVSLDPNRMILGDYVSRQDEYAIETTVDIARIADNLPEIIYPLIAPLYEGFGFFQLPLSLPSEEIVRMRRRV